MLSILGRDAMWGDIRKFFRQRSEQLSMQEWTPAAVREVERSLQEDSPELRGSFLGCLRHVCDMELAIERGMTPAEAGFVRRLRRKLESKTPFLKSPLAKHSEDLIRSAHENQDWKSLLGICDLARVLGVRIGRNPLQHPLVSDAVFWEVLFGLSLQARAWNRLHKTQGSRQIRPLDVYIGASIVPVEGGEIPSLSFMRGAASSGSWMSGSLDRWLQEIIQQPGDSLIPLPSWTTPWSWLRQAADQILASPVGTRSAVVNTIARALQEMGWDADRPKDAASERLQRMIEELASRQRGSATNVRPSSATQRIAPDTGVGFETGSFSIFQPEMHSGGEATAIALPAAAFKEKSVFRDQFKEKCLAWKAAIGSGLTPDGKAWWEDFLGILETMAGERRAWAVRMREVADSALIAGFEDLVRFFYPAPVRPGRLAFSCLDRYPPDPRDGKDRVVLDMLYSACDECLGNSAQPTALVAVRRWQAQSNARLLPSHSPGWWEWLAQEGAARAELVQTQESRSFPAGARETFLAMPSVPSDLEDRLAALGEASGMDPMEADDELHRIILSIETAKEQSLRDLLTRF